MTDLEYINHFFSSPYTAEEKLAFERRVKEDPLFAGEVTFFLNTMQAANERHITEKKLAFKELYKAKQLPKKPAVVRKMMIALAAAAILGGLLIGYQLFIRTESPNALAAGYIKDNLHELSVTMGSNTKDSLQQGLDLYNQGKLSEAALLFENMMNTDSGNADARKYAGIVYLRLQEYDKALANFRKLEKMADLHGNPGKFYEALSLMARDSPGDVEIARQLLRQVVSENGEGSEKAREWVKKL